MTARRARFSGAILTVRAVALGAASVFISIIGHSVAGGPLPAFGPLLLAFALCTAISSTITGKRLVISALFAFVVALQLLVHILLAVGSTHTPPLLGHSSLIPDHPMLAAHAVATLLVVAVLGHADVVMHQWLRFLRQLACEYTTMTLAPPAPLAVIWPLGHPLKTMARIEHDVARRGPPITA